MLPGIGVEGEREEGRPFDELVQGEGVAWILHLCWILTPSPLGFEPAVSLGQIQETLLGLLSLTQRYNYPCTSR